ncbi:adenine-specific methyltransferase EcoRI family protein [Mycoplasma sp. E35C]|uniref:adenine-specific methyltransferase EcoRI family protein n=1 Tax=Mycoplasma sp. E35C TaxID=2801918 RepID=UPI002105D6FF|nr:adenine-specific methyltransferase EcoRI family protein [Mycoplasma sp. E35C]
MSKSRELSTARKNKKDEFYTQLTDIEKEMVYYKNFFKDKVIYCNCDDPEWSNFFNYFKLNFDFFQLKKLITTHFDYKKPTYKLEYDGKNIQKSPLRCNGDFRSDESIELLKQADIVITNPPFSLFREYISQLIEHDKKFLIIGNQNAISTIEVFNYFKENKVWYGVSISSGDREFRVPDSYELNAIGTRTDSQGNKYIRVKGVRWFTNLDHKKRHEEFISYKPYNPEEYPKFDNYNAINIDKTKEIPMDYYEPMGVPITFLDKYNPDQFEILDANNISINGLRKKPHGLIKDKEGSVNGLCKYVRIVIRRKKQ